MPEQQMYIQQQQPPLYYPSASMFPQLPYQQQLLRQQYTPATQQILPTYIVAAANTKMPPTIIPDDSTMLRTSPYRPYNQTATRQSKAIKIVNPETMKEVDTSNLKKSSPTSSAHSTPKPTAESQQVEQHLKQTVNVAVDSKDNEVILYWTKYRNHSAKYIAM